METYTDIKVRHQKEVDAFNIGAAFSNEQLAEMMAKFGLPNDKTGYAQIVSLGYGAYIMRKDVPAWNEMSERHKREMREFRKRRKNLKEALRYEFRNHESQFCLQEDVICQSVGLTWDEVRNDKELLKIWEEAWKLFWSDCVKNDWF